MMVLLHHELFTKGSGPVLFYFSLTTAWGRYRIWLRGGLTVSSCTLWLCRSWSWRGQCSPRLFLPATHRLNNSERQGLMMTSNHFLTLTPAVALQQATSSIFTQHVMVTYSRSDWNHPRASKSDLSVTYAWIRAWWDVSGTVSVRKHREAAVAKTSVTHSHCICASCMTCWIQVNHYSASEDVLIKCTLQTVTIFGFNVSKGIFFFSKI